MGNKFNNGDIVTLIKTGETGTIAIFPNRVSPIMKFSPSSYDNMDGVYYNAAIVKEDEIANASTEEKIRHIEIKHNKYYQPIQTHVIGDYQIIEDENGMFYPHFNFNPINVAHNSINSALIGVICKSHLDSDEKLSEYVLYLLGIEW